MALDIQPSDLQAHRPTLDLALARRLIEGTLARAIRVAPCLAADDFIYADAAKAVIIDAILRRVDQGSGVVSTESVGPFSKTYAPSPRSLFWPAEITELQALCSAAQPAQTPLPQYAMTVEPQPWQPVVLVVNWPPT